MDLPLIDGKFLEDLVLTGSTKHLLTPQSFMGGGVYWQNCVEKA